MGSSRMNRLLLILFVTVTMAVLASSVVGKGKGVRTGGEQRYAGKQVRKLNSEKTGRNVRPVKEGRKTGNVKKTITTGKEGRKAGYGKKTLPRKQERNAVNEKKIGVRKSSSQEAARQDTSCVTSTACIGNATNYYNKILIKKVYNFKIQRERIKAFSKQSSGKNSKNEIFILLINRIREVGGGNSSNLTCNEENNDGATNLETLSTTLSECETKIYEACDSSQSGPNANSTYIDECNDLVDAFTDMTDTATKAKGAAACVLWEADDLKEKADAIKTCTAATVAFNKQTTKAKQKCTKAFSACKTAEDSVTAAVSACSPSNTVTKVTAAIKQGYQNIASIGDLKTKVDALITDSSITVNSTNSTSNRHRRQASSSTAAATTTTAAPTTTTAAGTTTAGSACSTFIDAVATAKLNAAPLLTGTQTLIDETNSLSVASCTVSEQSALATESVSITSAVTNVETIISVKQTDIDTQTGTTIEASELSITTIAATTVTAGTGITVTTAPATTLSGTMAAVTTASGSTVTGTTATGTTATGTTGTTGTGTTATGTTATGTTATGTTATGTTATGTTGTGTTGTETTGTG